MYILLKLRVLIYFFISIFFFYSNNSIYIKSTNLFLLGIFKQFWIEIQLIFIFYLLCDLFILFFPLAKRRMPRGLREREIRAFLDSSTLDKLGLVLENGRKPLSPGELNIMHWQMDMRNIQSQSILLTTIN